MEKRSGNVKNVQRNMQFNQIGKLIVKLVELESTNVTVAHSFQGIFLVSSYMFFGWRIFVSSTINAHPFIEVKINTLLFRFQPFYYWD